MREKNLENEKNYVFTFYAISDDRFGVIDRRVILLRIFILILPTYPCISYMIFNLRGLTGIFLIRTTIGLQRRT